MAIENRNGNDSDAVRLNLFLARSGMASRRAAEAYIREGRVEVNGKIVTDLSTTVKTGRDAVKVDGTRIHLQANKEYFILYKPREVISTMNDPEGRRCLREFLPRPGNQLFPVGRLDYHSEGLLLLTNDGELANRLLHPRYKTIKTYHIKAKGTPSETELDRLRRGITINGRRTLPVTIRQIPSRETRHTWLEVKMTEGRKNQLREMFFRIDHPVIKLKRVAVGPLRSGKMKPGQVRPLTVQEVAALREHVGLGRTAEDSSRKKTGKKVGAKR